ncbi:MAG: SpoIIE family protein phosphatase [Planctomycetaceae bacterium]|nr:SpoIIE family protein phosphatase [Planctomycetaceae bacterium]
MAVLQQRHGEPSSLVFEIAEDGITSIGRHEDCDVVVESPAISRFHCQIVCEDGRFFLEDLNSRNGTFVNGAPPDVRTLLRDGDLVEIANLPFEFLSQDSLAEASGSWGIRADVVAVNPGIDDEDSVRRQPIRQGDHISEEMLGSDSIREARIVATVSVADAGAGWPVRENAIQKLNFVLRLVHSLRRTTDVETIIARTLQFFFEAFPSAQRIAVVMKDRQQDALTIKAAVSREEDEVVEICLPVVRRCVQNLEGLLYVDHWFSKIDRGEQPADGAIRTILAVPLVGLVGECLGVLQLDTSDLEDSLDESDLERLAVLSPVVSASLEQAWETQQAVAVAVIQNRLAEASKLRLSLTPRRPPVVKGYRIDCHLVALTDVAGDFVDFVELPDGRVACLMIDVPGRGADAARLMTLVARLLADAILQTGQPAAALRKTQQSLFERLADAPMVISAAVMIVAPDRSSLTVAVAGHCPLYQRRQGRWQTLSAEVSGGAALGIATEAWADTEVPLRDGDSLVLFSDGIAKLPLSEAEAQSEDRVWDLLQQAAPDGGPDLIPALQRHLGRFEQEATLTDDVLVVHFLRQAGTQTATTIPTVILPPDG